MTLTEAAFRRRPLIGMILIALMVFGAASYVSLPAREDPKITIRTSVIITEHPGLSTERMERLITRPLEEAVRRIPEIDEIRSLTLPGRSIIHAEVDPAIFELDQIWDDLRSRVSAARPALPEGTHAPRVNTDFGDVAIVTAAHMDQVARDLRAVFREVAPEAQARVTRMFLGPSDSSKLEVQVTGPDATVLVETGERIKTAFRDVPGVRDVATDWQNRIAKVVVDVDQTRARRAGVTAADVSRAVAHAVEGLVATPFREGDDPFPIVLRADAPTRADLERLETVPVFASASGANVPLAQVTTVRMEGAWGRIARVDLQRALTIEARNIAMTAEDMVPLMTPALDVLRAELPPGHTIAFSGVVADSAESSAALAANTPLCLAIIVVLLVAQFNSYRRPLLILATIPLILIGAVAGLLVTGANFGFMPILGLFALSGIITINAIVLIDRIDLDRAAGMEPFEALVTASMRRLRPILMTTITTILGLAPLILGRDALFYGMASVIAFGLLVGTLLTLGVVPVLYSLLFGIRTPGRANG